jgi:SAM-dependent methyltransferase
MIKNTILKSLIPLLLPFSLLASAAQNEPQDGVALRTKADVLRLVPPAQIKVALDVLRTFYEVNPRNIRNNHKYGQSFPVNAEMLCELMEQAPGAHVLEIAGATGENSILLGLAGADRVYMNDIVPEEVGAFQSHVATLAPDQQSKFVPLVGSCFDLADYIPHHSLDIILARNIVHLLRPSQYAQFFDVVKLLLKPGGTFAMTVNSRYGFLDSLGELSLEHTSFTSHLTILDRQGQAPMVLTKDIALCAEDKDPTGYTNHHVAEFSTRFNDNHRMKPHVLGALPEVIRGRVHRSVEEFKVDRLTVIMGAKLRVLENTTILFTPENLRALVGAQGLNVVSTAHIGADGHYRSEAFARRVGAIFVGLVARAPEVSASAEEEKE